MITLTPDEITAISNQIIDRWKPEDYWWTTLDRPRSYAGLTLTQCGEIVDWLHDQGQDATITREFDTGPKQWRVHVTFNVKEQ